MQFVSRCLVFASAAILAAPAAMAQVITPPPNDIPEPGAIALLAVGAAGLWIARRRRK